MNKLYKLGFLVLLLVFGYFLISPMIRDRDLGTEIVFFAAGDGDSILIKNKDGVILIDTGLKENRVILGDKLKTMGISTIDYMILTHPDKDHIGGASYILDNFQVKNLLQSSFIKGSKAETRIGKSLKAKPINNLILEEDFNFQVGISNCILRTPLFMKSWSLS